jgi:hypothetical protein
MEVANRVAVITGGGTGFRRGDENIKAYTRHSHR